MSSDLIRPIDPETARAIEETAKLGSKIVDAGMKTGSYLDRVVGGVPDHLVGLIDDWLIHRRARRWARLQAETLDLSSQMGRQGTVRGSQPIDRSAAHRSRCG